MGETLVKEIPFAGGYDQKTAVEYLDPAARLVTVQDGNYLKQGVVDKRLGLKHLSTNIIANGTPGMVAPTTGTRLASWSRSQLAVMSAAGGLYALSNAEGALTAISPLPPARVIARPMIAAPPPNADDGIPPGLLCDFTWNGALLRMGVQVQYSATSQKVVASVWDPNTGDVVLPLATIFIPTGASVALISASYCPNAPAGNQIVIAVLDLATNHPSFIYYSPGANAFTTTTFVGITVFNGGGIDVQPFVNDPAGGTVMVYWSSATTLTWLYQSGSLGTTTGGTVETVVGALNGQVFVYASSGAAEQIWFAYGALNAGAYSYRVAALHGDGTFAASLAPMTFFAAGATAQALCGVARLTAASCFIPLGNLVHPASQAFQAFVGNGITVTTGGGTATVSIPTGMRPIARPFVVGSTLYLACMLLLYSQAGVMPADTHSQQGTIYLLQLSANTSLLNRFLPVATVAPRQVDIASYVFGLFFGPPIGAMSAQVGPLTGGTRCALPYRTISTGIAALVGSNDPSWAVDFYFDGTSQSLLYQSCELGTELDIAAGTPMVADGMSCFEDNFVYYPEFSYVSGVAAGTTYSYAVLYVYVHASGLVERSAPVFTNQVNVLGGTVNIPYLSCTYRDGLKPGQVFAEIYRTVSNGSTFYLLTRIPISNAGAGNYYAAYGPDNTTDANLQLASFLYVTGGVLDNVNPPVANLQIAHRGRRVIVDETLRRTWETKQFIPGEVPGFNEALVTPYPEGGDITALASLDDKLLVFKASSIWVRYGDGPADTGQGSDWSVPQRVASDVGALDWRSVVLTPVGVMFQAVNQGLYLFGRDMQVTFIGKNVVDLMAATPIVVAAALVPNTTQVRFVCTNATGTSSVAVVYDYLLNEWTLHTYATLSAGAASAAVTASDVYTTGQSNRYALLTTDGKLWMERQAADATPWFDDDAVGTTHFVPTKLTTAWFRAGGTQSYMRARRVQLLANRLTSCALTMQLAFNMDPTVQQTKTWTAAQLDNAQWLGTDKPVSVHVAARWCKVFAMQVTVSDSVAATDGAAAGSPGQGMRWAGLLAELDAIGSRYRQVPAALRG